MTEMTVGMKPFTTSEELPEPVMGKARKGVAKMTGYGEPRYFIRATPLAYEMIKVFKKPHGILRKHCFTMKRKNKKHMAEFKKYQSAGIPVVAI